MENLKIEGTKSIPHISFDAATGILSIEGRSIPEDSKALYDQLIEWVEAYGEVAQMKTVLRLYMHYFNTSSSNGLLRLFKAMAALHEAGKTRAVVYWYYDFDDDELLESGEAYSSIVNIPWENKPIEEPISWIEES